MGSNPTASDYARILFALGMARGLLHKYTNALPSVMDEKALADIDKIITEVCYAKPARRLFNRGKDHHNA